MVWHHTFKGHVRLLAPPSIGCNNRTGSCSYGENLSYCKNVLLVRWKTRSRWTFSELKGRSEGWMKRCLYLSRVCRGAVSWGWVRVVITWLILEPDPSLRKGLGTWPNLRCSYGMQLWWVISDRWQHHTYVHCRSAHCPPQVLCKTQNSTAICRTWSLATLKAWRKIIPWCHLQSMIPIGQDKIPSWGRLECTRVPRPFLLLWRVWFWDCSIWWYHRH